jgi:hypothetical protein
MQPAIRCRPTHMTGEGREPPSWCEVQPALGVVTGARRWECYIKRIYCKDNHSIPNRSRQHQKFIDSVIKRVPRCKISKSPLFSSSSSRELFSLLEFESCHFPRRQLNVEGNLQEVPAVGAAVRRSQAFR